MVLCLGAYLADPECRLKGLDLSGNSMSPFPSISNVIWKSLADNTSLVRLEASNVGLTGIFGFNLFMFDVFLFYFIFR